MKNHNFTLQKCLLPEQQYMCSHGEVIIYGIGKLSLQGLAVIGQNLDLNHNVVSLLSFFCYIRPVFIGMRLSPKAKKKSKKCADCPGRPCIS